MTKGQLSAQLRKVLWIAILSAVIGWYVRPASAQAPEPPPPLRFQLAAPEGFGDRQNTGAWSMQWWRGKLYVGTVRSWFCWSQAWFSKMFPFIPYPPKDPDMECAEDPLDLPLQAEIWSYTPETKEWERVYQSPNDVPVPGHPGRFTSRDVGFRGMTVFTEVDGTEALYVGGVTSNALWSQMPPPRILRSTDGKTFQAIPQEPGTILGDLSQDQASFRSLLEYEGRLYVLNGQVRGQGSVLESADPAMGNDEFRWITPQGLQVFEMAVFNGWLYIGTASPGGYEVVKTDASGSLPYTFIPVVTSAADGDPPSPSVVSMRVFQNWLYVGTDTPAELIRINPDDTWELIMGKERMTPDGIKSPLSGMGTGFDWPMNVHVWRIIEHEGVLYIGTMDQSTRWERVSFLDEKLRSRYGFDLFATTDGIHLTPITLTGFGDKFQVGVRSMASTPYGLFFGTVSFWRGLQIWQGSPIVGTHRVFLPLALLPPTTQSSVDTAASAPRSAGDGSDLVWRILLENQALAP